jgi:large subunit ribosomal protein L3
MKKAILAEKVGMTQVFSEDGSLVPVTVLSAGPCVVTQVKTVENDGYEAVQVGFGDKKEKVVTKDKNGTKSVAHRHGVNKPEKGHFDKAGVSPKRHLKEFRLEGASEMNTGDVVAADTFAAGDKVDITGITKGRGYTGAVKRWGHHILKMTHGTGPVHREVGSMGACSSPSRVYKNKKMAGQYGNEQVTVLNLEVVKVDAGANLVAVKGAVPGARGGIVFIRDSVKA